MKEQNMDPISSRITKLVNERPDLDDDEIAVGAMRSYGDMQSLEQAVEALVVDEVRRCRRNQSREVERAAFDPQPGRQRAPEAMIAALPRTSPDTVRSLADMWFFTTRGEKVRWVEATVADHEQRIGFLGRQVAGISTTINRHERAIQLIRDAGVTCLGQIPDWSAHIERDAAA